MTPQQERDRQYFTAGVRASVTWLHRRAEAMGDPHARAILNTAAFHLATEKLFKPERSADDHV